MKADPPDILFREQLRFEGSVRRDGHELPVLGMVVERTKYRYLADATFRFEVPRTERDKLMWLIGSTGRVEFAGTLVHRNGARMVHPPPAAISLRWTSERSGRVGGNVDELQVGVADLPSTPVHQSVIVRFTPTSLAFPETEFVHKSYTGEIMPNLVDEAREPYLLDTSIGQFKLARYYEQEEATVNGEAASVLVPVVAAFIELDTGVRTPTLRQLINTIADEFAPIEWVLSFLSRRHVRNGSITVHSSGFAEEHSWSEATHETIGFATRNPATPLVDAESISHGGLSAVVDQVRTTAYREPIEHAISYLIAYWGSRYVEDKVASAFTAFETLINGITGVDGTMRTMDDATFASLSTHLRKSIKAYLRGRGLDSIDRAAIYEKLPELQRRGLIPRAMAVINAYSVPWQDVWPWRRPSEDDLAAFLRSAYRRRSEFVHTGIVEDYGELYADAASVHALTERLVFAVLKCDENWLYHAAHRYAARRGRYSH